MKSYSKIIIAISIFTISLICIWAVNSYVKPAKKDTVAITREQQHITAMQEGADPSIGITEIPDDMIVGDDFESHLPLVVIDIAGQEIPMTKSLGPADDGINEKIVRSGEDPFVNGKISIINNHNYINHLSDEAETSSDIKIRYRGNGSLSFEKKQYAIKMVDSEGNSSKVNVLGMGENNDWILNISMIDGSLMRNYVSLNFGSSLFPYTPDCKFCEVVFKNEQGEYEYQGLYLMMEKIEEGQDRVDIKDYQSGDDLVSYLLLRDREDETANQISTFGNENKLTNGRITILYPDDEVLDDYAFNYIQKDIDSVERVLYSDDLSEFNTWTEYLDKQSFVDYYLFNCIFRNYDAGDNSTYMYRDGSKKICMGPVWDYDNAADNDYSGIQIPDHEYFKEQPWFNRLIYSKEYVSTLENRYKELTSGIFSSEYIGNYIDDVAGFLGNAAKRDWSRWKTHYGENSAISRSYGKVDSQGFAADRRTESFEDEASRFKDYFSLEELYMEDNLKELEEDTYETKIQTGGYYALLFIVTLVCSVVIIKRRGYMS